VERAPFLALAQAALRFEGIAHDVQGFDIILEGYNKPCDLPKGYRRGKTSQQPNHMMDILSCVRSRDRPRCPVDEAFIETATFLMSVESYHQQRLVRGDPVKEEIV